jgi:hypothetical protein
MQVVLRHETPKRETKVEKPAGFEVPWIDQLVPFHFSARVWVDPLPLPAAVQDVSVAQETSWRTLAMLPEGLGVLCRFPCQPPERRFAVLAGILR